MPAKGATVFIGAPKHGGGTGGPARIMAVIAMASQTNALASALQVETDEGFRA